MLLSPSKTVDFESDTPGFLTDSEPVFKPQSEELVSDLQSMSQGEIKELMHLSDNLAELNYGRYQNFKSQTQKQCIYAFRGDVYDGLGVDTLNQVKVEYLNNNLGVLSGLYGLLRPSDVIQAHRLEMGTRLNGTWGKNLYEFWNAQITNRINEVESELVVNLASQEYFKSVQAEQLNGKVFNIHFKENKAGKVRVIAIYAKKARGLYGRWAAQNNIRSESELNKFNMDGYRFAPELSSEFDLVFVRTH